MAMITHLTTPEAFDGTELVIEGPAYRHLFRSRRLAKGARIRLVDGKGRARWAEVRTIDRRTATLGLGEAAESHEPAYRLDLWVAALRPERAAWLVEKATELGAASIRFFRSERTPRNYGEGNIERWRRMAATAVEQCHRARCPEISGVETWQSLCEATGPYTDDANDLLVLDAEGYSSTHVVPPGKAGMVVVGPEGGLSEAELAELEALDATPLSLGRRVLRVETAALVAAARQLALD